MSFYRVCPSCGANLDPGEACDCQDKAKPPAGAANTGEVAKVEWLPQNRIQ